MNSTLPTAQPTHSTTSATNFDLPSLHILRTEINVALSDAESHLSEFNDDEEQAPLLLDSYEVMLQLAQVLNLMSLDGGSDLSEALGLSLKLLHDNGDNTDDELIMDISEAIMTLDRYIEFVLLKETLEPVLLLPIINKLYAHLGKSQLDKQNFHQRQSGRISISNPEENYQSLSQLPVEVDTLSHAYRAGLAVLLANHGQALSEPQLKKIHTMQQASQIIAQQSNSLFWQASTAAVMDIEKQLPLTHEQKRIFVFIEQQFHDYLPINDKRFADLVSFALKRNNPLSKSIREQYANNALSVEQQEQLNRFLFGPNREVTDTLNQLIQEQINSIKDQVDGFVRGDGNINAQGLGVADIATELNKLASTLKLLNLDDAAQTVINESQRVSQWQSADPDELDEFLVSMIVAENAAIHMAKLHTPGAVNMLPSNKKVSLHQIDTAHQKLVLESRTTLATVEQAINDYIADDNHDHLHIANLPEMLKQVAGSVRFLSMKDSGNMLNRLANYVQAHLLDKPKPYDDNVLAKIADVVAAVDYQLDGLENNRPVGKHVLNVGHHSLNTLLAA